VTLRDGPSPARLRRRRAHPFYRELAEQSAKLQAWKFHKLSAWTDGKVVGSFSQQGFAAIPEIHQRLSNWRSDYGGSIEESKPLRMNACAALMPINAVP